MSRSPLAYPLTRGIDADSGGAADLQTDIMRFMAILALCLVAIFALVQSLPMQPQLPAEPLPVVESATVAPVIEQDSPTIVEQVPTPTIESANASPAPLDESTPAFDAPPAAEHQQAEETVVLTRPQWVSTFQPPERIASPQTPTPVAAAPPVATGDTPKPAPRSVPEPAPRPTPEQQDGFTLRFESDLALTRLVAAGQVGFYAIDSGRAQRMSVSSSRISFWDASTPNAFHEMEAMTVPAAVIDALARSGANTGSVNWGVTLPGKLSRQLDALMRQHAGGSLVIRGDGNLELEAG